MLEVFLKCLVIPDHHSVFRSKVLKCWPEACGYVYKAVASCGVTGWQVSCRQTGHATVSRGHWVIPEMFLIPYRWVGEWAITRWSAFPVRKGVGNPSLLNWFLLNCPVFSSKLHPWLMSPSWELLWFNILRLNLQSARQTALLVVVVGGVGKGTWQFNHLVELRL